MYTRRILCLANSYKHHGRCVAGRLFDNGIVGNWLRPVSAREGRALLGAELRYGRFLGEVSVGDIANVNLSTSSPSAHQPENHVIEGNGGWERIGKATWTMLFAAQDNLVPAFWLDFGRSSSGCADRIPEELSSSLTCSLQMIYLPRLELLVQPNFKNGFSDVRARFGKANQEYILKVTDPVICSEYQRKPPGIHPMGMALLCVSVSEPFKGFVYRIVASIITPGRCETAR